MMLKKIFSITIIILIFIFVVLIGGHFYVENKINTPAGNDSVEKIFVVQKGEGVDEIASALEKEGLIKKALYFKIYTLRRSLTRSLQAGKYLLSSEMTIPQIVERLTRGEIMPDEKKITIVEGWNINQIAEYLEEEGIAEKNVFIARANCGCGVDTRRDFLIDKPEGASLEGYLFPDTYFIKKDASASQIINKMLDNFDRKLTDEMRREIKTQNKTIFEIVTLASIVEKEVRTDEDRAKVAGIFYKRLKEGKPLESCATISYILGVNKKQYTYEDTRVSSPYNTYINKGLPPGPISNPSLSSLKAAIWPENTPYRYFLSKKDGETVFSKTLEEHNANKAKWLQ